MIELKPFSLGEDHKEVVSTYDYWIEYKGGKKSLEIQSGNAAFALGYNHKKLKQQVYDNEVDFVRGNTGESTVMVESLSDLLCNISNMKSIAYAVSGSDANESAINAVDRYWVGKGQYRPNIVSIAPCYHGTTYLTKTLSTEMEKPNYSGWSLHNRTKVILGKRWINSKDQAENEAEKLKLLKEYLENHGTEVGALILESIPWNDAIAPYSKEFWISIEELVSIHDILLIIDDVAGCFGKNQHLFTHQALNMRPDIITIGKSLTNGITPLSASLHNDKVSSVIANKTWEHGHTWQPNVNGCVAAQVCLMEHIQKIEDDKHVYIGTKLDEFGRHLMNANLSNGFVRQGSFMGIHTFGIDVSLAKLSKHGLAATTAADTLKLVVPTIADDRYFNELTNRVLDLLDDVYVSKKETDRIVKEYLDSTRL